MKTSVLDNRYKAKYAWGYNYAVSIPFHHFPKFSAVKEISTEMFGASHNIYQRMFFIEVRHRLKTSEWAFKWDNTTGPRVIYFRDKKDMEKVLLLFALKTGS